MKKLKIKNINIGESAPLTVVCGPCVIESESHALQCADFLTSLFEKKGVQFIFKASYDKANRSSHRSFRGLGIKEGLRILELIKKKFNIPVFTDVHSPEEAKEAAQICDVIQIPAFLCRQTDLLIAAGTTEAVISIKKGQFMAPWDMKNVIDKVVSTGNTNILLTERGASFGYNNLVSDMRAIPIMQDLGYPVLFDATHSVQIPSGLGNESGGERKFVSVLARAAIAAGCNGIYAEAHPDPEQAFSDRACMIPFKDLSALVDQWVRIYEALHTVPLNPERDV